MEEKKKTMNVSTETSKKGSKEDLLSKAKQCDQQADQYLANANLLRGKAQAYREAIELL